MLHPFISSPRASQHLTPVLALSASIHAALFYGAITSTGTVRRPTVPAAVVEAVRFVDLASRRLPNRARRSIRRAPRANAARARGTEHAFRLPQLALTLDLALPEPAPMPDFQPDVSMMELGRSTGIADDVLHLGVSAASNDAAGDRYAAYDERAVEKSVLPHPGNPSPRYPDRMLNRGIESRFDVTFVVDTSGTVDQRTVEWPPLVERDFMRAVAEVLSNWRFVPAQIGGRRVRQRVLQPFLFRVDGRIAMGSRR
jgi:protein TonB